MHVYVGVGAFPEEHFDLSQPPDVVSPPHEGAAWLALPSSTPRSVGRGEEDRKRRGMEVGK